MSRVRGGMGIVKGKGGETLYIILIIFIKGKS